ncbi:MAG: tetratricopeptide repeat protein [bacterium]
MQDAVRIRIMHCFEQRRYDSALALAEDELSRASESDANLFYLAGQSCRFLGRLTEAREYLERAVSIDGEWPELLLALGVVMQLQGDWAAALQKLRRAIDLKPDYELARNSLGLTFMKMGRPKEALEQYDLATSWYARRVAQSLPNERTSAVFAHEDTVGEMWAARAVDAMLFIGAECGAETVAWPTGAQATEEIRTRAHEGLLYARLVNRDGKRVLQFLPNFFNSFREQLKSDLTYAILLNNLGGALAALGRRSEARSCYLEAIEFTPVGLDYAPPRDGLAALADD